MRRAAAAWVLVLASLLPAAAAPPAAGDGAEWSERIECGPLVLEVRASRTAHLFHVVDQLSGWSEFCHGQYRRAMALDAADEEALKRHAALREERGWGGGPEQAFYTPAPLEEALRAAVKSGHLAEGQAAVEREVFARFEARVDALLRAHSGDLRKSLASLDREAVTRLAKSLARLCGTKSLAIPTYLLASPPPGSGGGYNGGRMAIELAPGQDAASTLVHEAVHAFLEPRAKLLEECASRTEGLDPQTLNEGIAYAVMPGIFSAGEEDRLAAQVARDLAAGAGLEQSYPRFNRYGLALRPVVREALEKGDLPALLARSRDVWLALREVEAARRPARFICAGPGWEAFLERAEVLGRGRFVYSFNHDPGHYGTYVAGLRKGDVFVLTFAGDSGDRQVPEGYHDLLPVPLADVWKEIAAQRTVERAGMARGARVVLLAAPTKQALSRLVLETKSLAE